ncbi:choline dehydrogenase [Rhodoferax sp. TH121]|uniref:GMC family oxidoreductase n=1 Tax=Rhodoferax sp. TH121 TaxID=2022803 RepID=UPI000B972762|nr:GMC family oxidoreductase N-terminal domain-containing protein [Rhodoferax sp. TH121]OYQ40873.1 choline dehydrogenase [Rhodoferax sp. TH121]
MSDFDYIVVGGGTAGALLANRLSADPHNAVLLVEAGGRDRYHWIHIPVGYLYCINNPKTDWCFRTEPDPGLNGRALIYPRGKTLGGCSSINGMIYMRGQSRDYDGWAEQLRDAQWNWSSCLPFFKQHEWHHRLDANPQAPHFPTADFHGGQGEWRVERQRLRWELLDAFARAAQQAGIPSSDDFNTGSNEGVGYFEVNQKSGLRWNTSKAFLNADVRRRPNLTIWTNTQASKLLLARDAQGARVCRGLEVLRQGHTLALTARKEVVLCAGAIGTPQLLQLSGLGPAELLAKHGIPVVQAMEGVGQNLQDHLQIRAVYTVQNALTLNTLANSLWGKFKIGMQYALLRSGPMSMSPSQLGVFTRSDAARVHPNIQFHVQPLSLEAFGQPLHRFPALTASVCNLNPSSRGQVAIRSKDCTIAPAIAPNYLSTQDDQQVAADSLRVARRILEQPAMQPYAPVEYKPGVQYQTDSELIALAGDIATTIFHPVGTAKMGLATDAMAVTDSRLRVHGVRGLRIADASAMPTIVSGNTNSPTLMMAEKAAAWIRTGE